MLVNPSVQQPSYTVQPSQVSNGAAQEKVVRSDLPPVEQSSDSSSAQDKQLQTEQQFQQNLQRQQAADDQLSQANEAQARADASQRTKSEESNALQAQQEKAAAAEEHAAEQQRLEDEAIISQLKVRDREVRLHEAAHAAVGGRFAGAPSLDYEKGPDGVNYAVSGEVPISTSKVPGDPEATIEKARVIRAAANAPAEPSAQDRRVAAEATQLETEARIEIQQTKLEVEQERKERLEETRNEELEEEGAEEQLSKDTSVEVSGSEAQSVETPQVASQSSGEGESGEQESRVSGESEEKTTAKDELEEILLGTGSVSKALNQAGLVDAQNPYGKSGLIEYIV